jgi:hypothetical protein
VRLRVPTRGSSVTGTNHRLDISATVDAQSPGPAFVQPLANQRLHYDITGQHPGSGEVTTSGDGRAAITWDGSVAGEDRVTVWVDVNGDGDVQAGEPEAVASVKWLDPPRVLRTANVEPVSGLVLVRLPRGTDARKVGLAGSTAGFQPLAQAAEIPLGSTFDTSRGQVLIQTALGSAANKPRTQLSEHRDGRFLLAQRGSRRNPLTDVTLNETLVCGGRRGNSRRVTASRARSRRLWSRARGGRYRTRGRYSSAAVRGTVWVTKDTCTSTTTAVREGVVVIRDFAKRKNVRLRAGRRYVARATASRR